MADIITSKFEHVAGLDAQLTIRNEFVEQTVAKAKHALETELVRLDLAAEASVDATSETPEAAIKILELLLLWQTTPTFETFKLAIEHADLLQLFLPHIDPSADYNWAICTASANGFVDVVALLLADERVDPSAKDNYAVRMASAKGHTAVVKLLLERVDPSARNNYAVRVASAKGHTEVVKLLLADARVDPSTWNNSAIQFASANGQTAVVKLLLADERVDPSADGNYAVRLASENGQTEVVELLLADRRVVCLLQLRNQRGE
jgi:hypothetical protein